MTGYKTEYFCWGCGGEIKSHQPHCGRLECAMRIDDMNAEEVNHFERRIRIGLWNSLRQWCSWESNYSLAWRERIFYVLKLWVCAALCRRRHFDWTSDSISVGGIMSRSDGYGWHAEWLAVGVGLFSGWHYNLESDGDCYI